MTTSFSLRASLICLFAMTFSVLAAPPARADYQVAVWGAPPASNTMQKTAIASCRASTIGAGGPATPLYYKGYLFKEMLDVANRPYEKVCVDINQNSITIRLECRIYRDNGQWYLVYNGKCYSPTPCPCVEREVGNPAELPGLVKVETAADWASPKDRRFQIVRNYRSDPRLSERFEISDVRDGFGGVWRFAFDEMLQSGFAGLSANKHVFTTGNGTIALFEASNLAATQASLEGFSMSVSPIAGDTRLTVVDGAGMRRFFIPDGANRRLLDEVRWPDGYRISFLRGADNRLTTGAPIDLRFPGQWFQIESGLHQN